MCGVLYKRYVHPATIKDCECLTDENVLEYEKWLEKQSTSGDSDHSTVVPGSLSTTNRSDTVTPNTEAVALDYAPSPMKTLHWTKLVYTNTTVFSAYYDNRPKLSRLPSILVLGYQAKSYRASSLYCLFRYIDGSTECSARRSIILEMDNCNHQKEFDHKKEREFLHVFHMCQLKIGNEIPSHIALSHKNTCTTSTEFIPVFQYRPPSKINFGVCVQTPAFQKKLHEFVNFVEMHRLLGAEHITLYTLDIEQSVLSNLQKMFPNIIEIINWPRHQFYEKEPIHYYGEILAMHDCLYRNMYAVEYLVFVDLDEVLIPKRYKDLKSMMLEIDQPYIDSFVFVNSVFMKSSSIKSTLTKCDQNVMPDYFTHFDRAKCEFLHFSRSKLIIKPELIFDTDIHGVCTRVGNTTHYLVPTSSASSHHYRKTPTIECRRNRKTRKYDSVYDDWMMKYTSSLYSSTNKIMCNQ